MSYSKVCIKNVRCKYYVIFFKDFLFAGSLISITSSHCNQIKAIKLEKALWEPPKGVYYYFDALP